MVLGLGCLTFFKRGFSGIEGAFSEPGQKTVIPKKVVGKFSIRIVPNQEPAKIEAYVVNYVKEQWKRYGSPNEMKVHIK